jgi:hypothetical protein
MNNIDIYFSTKFLDGKEQMLWIETSHAPKQWTIHQHIEMILTTRQSQFDIDSINSLCFHTPLEDPKLPYLFYTNEARLKHNESTFLWNDGDVYIFHAKDKHHDTCSKSFQLQNDLNSTTKLH